MKNKFMQFHQRIKFVKLNDIRDGLIMIPAFIYSIFFRCKHKNIWLICERKSEARDNGYWFYKYVCENHPEIEAVYAIDLASPDAHKVTELGKVIQFGGFIHWVHYFSAERNVSSQKEGKPNAAVCYVLEVYLNLIKNRAYIRHGITKDNQRWVYYDVTKMNLFVCSAKREYEYVKNKFGYPEDNVKLLGLCRYDNLLSPHIIKKQILVMPTMREWLRIISSDTLKFENTTDISQTDFFKIWNHLLNSKDLFNILDNNDYTLIFYPHASLHKYIDYFTLNNSRVIIGDYRYYDVQQLLMESSILVTDYSSIYFDFGYMKKPLIYYQFDYEKYRKGQYQEGYFSYQNDGFGPIVDNENDLLEKINQLISFGCRMDEFYLKRVNTFFKFTDNENCKRTFEAVMNMK